eukprot:CAMPEP_0198310026 /NCGR_PEP_ID=MMETSP1450-20131203/2223_1 /TAXON_ID=753684 ORGANISM="Madagascaria erythrocladiodes, Strain CCMP3234" /NCGR_SAMPLE_ID=MMETSP1450 /ASSEMBLY_ACC=CAM_ASM_001115 /LENGTH=300 /DNA_ID=CAMNT_0044012815 /DNA_START=47 /DNA_END=949 /DNA_ORIENTATION=+
MATTTRPTSFYLTAAAGGALACGVTHAAITPLDVAKCRMQVDLRRYPSLPTTIRAVVAEEGVRGLLKGFTPALLGYHAQGMFKYGLYEYFKDIYSGMAGEENARKYRGLIWLAGSASAEFFADIALCPFEMVKVKVQTAPRGTWPVATLPATRKMIQMRGETRFPLGSLVPLWSRQIPYTMAKFFCFEKTISLFYTYVFTEDKESYSKGTQLGVTFASGYIAGIFCAVVSHPGDTLVSLLGKKENKGKPIAQIAREFGLRNLATAGLAARILMVGSLTGFQWLIFDSYKAAAGFATTGGK